MRIKYHIILLCLLAGIIHVKAQDTGNDPLLVISERVFMNANISQGIILPSNLQSIGTDAFRNIKVPCLNFLYDVELEHIGNTAFHSAQLSAYNVLDFSNCHKLRCININSTSGCFAGFSGEVILPEGLASIIRPVSLTTIEFNAFRDLTLTEDPTIDLSGYFKLKTIGNAAFMDSNIEEIILPDSLKQIGTNAFSGCGDMFKITSHNPVPPALGNTVFAGVDTDWCELIIPVSSYDLYAEADQWKDFLLSATNEISTELRFAGDADIPDSDLILYPNPVKEILHVNKPVDKIEVFSTSGQLVKVVRNASSINLNGIASGPYVVKITSSNESTIHKVIKK